MIILNFGSLNIDYVYSVSHIVKPGETLASTNFENFAGGKGANQSVALAKAGANAFHAGKVGPDGQWLKDKLTSAGADTSLIAVDQQAKTGHAIIQVDQTGQNAIVLHAGTNRSITQSQMDDALQQFSAGDLLLLQNEINDVPYLIETAHGKGMTVCLNPAPFDPQILTWPLHLVDLLVVNETEAMGIAGIDRWDSEIVQKTLTQQYESMQVILTLGEKGAVWFKSGEPPISVPAPKVNVVDTTAAGDTFIGYYLAAVTSGQSVKQAMQLACKAAGQCVASPGAMDSIPEINCLDILH